MRNFGFLSRQMMAARAPLVTPRMSMFSQYFRDLDKESWKEINHAYCGSKAYTKAVNLWKVPLQKKAERRARKEANPPVIQEPEASGEGMMYVHNAENGITLPPMPNAIFAVVNIKGS